MCTYVLPAGHTPAPLPIRTHCSSDSNEPGPSGVNIGGDSGDFGDSGDDFYSDSRDRGDGGNDEQQQRGRGRVRGKRGGGGRR